MIKSMTGYGRARQELHKRDITVEVRSVNNRYLDCTVKMPRMYAFAEDAVKKHVQQAVSRGKVDVFITVDATAADVVKVAVNRELAAQYAAALGELSDVCGTADYRPAPETLARFPDVLTVTKADEDLETVSADLCAVLDEALAAYNDMRAVEGQKLAEDISNRLDAIERYTGQVEMRSPETVAEISIPRSRDSCTMRLMGAESGERGMMIDATYGRTTASIFIMDSDHVVLSALPPERFAPKEERENEE